MTYTDVNPHACCNWPRLEDAYAASRRPLHPQASPYLTNNDGLRWKTDDRPPVNGPPTTALILLLSKHSTPPLPNTCPAPSAATLTILTLMPLVPLMPLMIVTKLLYLYGSVQGLFVSMFPPASYVEGTSLTTSLRYQDSCLEIS